MSKTLTIQMDRGRLCRPGDTIAGNVVLDATEQVDVKSISVKFEGRCKSKLVVNNGNNRRVYRGRVVLFYMEVELFKGPFTLPPGSRSWPFQFRIPDNCQYRSGDTFKPGRNYQEVFDENPQQPLPPTFHSDDWGFGGRKECYVSYMVDAKLDVNKFFSFNKDDMVGISLVPWRWEPNPQIPIARQLDNFDIHSLRLDPEVKDRDLSFGEHMKSFFQPGKLPMASFNLTLQHPQGAIVGQDLEMCLFLDHLVDKSTMKMRPVVELTRFSLQLTRRVSQITTAVLSFGDQQRNWENSAELVSWEGKVPIADVLDLRTVAGGGLMIPTRFPPSFSTFNIAVSYYLTVKYRIECAEKTEKFEKIVPRFMLLSHESPGMDVSMGQGPTTFGQGPSYEQGGPYQQSPAYGQSREINEEGHSGEEQLPAYTKSGEEVIH